MALDRRRGGTPPAKKRTNREQSKNIAGTVPVPNPNPKPNQFSGRWLAIGARHRPLGALLRWLWGWWAGSDPLGAGAIQACPGWAIGNRRGTKREQRGNKRGPWAGFCFWQISAASGPGGRCVGLAGITHAQQLLSFEPLLMPPPN